MPPGTGDAQLTLAQSVPVTAGITVTTPQEVSLDDSRRSLDMFQKLHIPTAGIIENMSGFICPSCSEESDIFGMGTTAPVAIEYDTELIARIPIEPAIRVGGDTGMPITYHKPDSETAKRYQEAASTLLTFIDKVNAEGGADNQAIQPTTPPGVSACSTGGATASASTQQEAHSHSGGGCGCS
jgi:ATP-binding protein involved in chromosome partitioning